MYLNTGLFNESFICSSVWMNRAKNVFFTSKRSVKSYICLLILMCGDVERLASPPNDLGLLLCKKGFSLLHQNKGYLLKNFDLVSDLLENNNIIILTLSETDIRLTDEVLVLNVTGYRFLNLPHKEAEVVVLVYTYQNNMILNAVKISKMQIKIVSGSKFSLKNRNVF